MLIDDDYCHIILLSFWADSGVASWYASCGEPIKNQFEWGPPQVGMNFLDYRVDQKGRSELFPKKLVGGDLTAYDAVYIRYGVSRNNTVISLFTLDAWCLVIWSTAVSQYHLILLLLCHKNLRCNGDYVELPSNINVLRLHCGSSI